MERPIFWPRPPPGGHRCSFPEPDLPEDRGIRRAEATDDLTGGPITALCLKAAQADHG